MRIGLCAVFGALMMTGCASKLPVVMAGGQAFKVDDQSRFETMKSRQDRLETLDFLFPTPKFLALFHGVKIGDSVTSSTPAAAKDDTTGKVAIMAAAGSTTAARSAGLAPLAAANVVTSILAADNTGIVADGLVKTYSAQTQFNSVTVAKFVAGQDVVSGFTQAYPELEPLLRENCKYPASPRTLEVVGDREGKFAQYCSTTNSHIFVYAHPSRRFPALKTALGDGVLISYTASGGGKSPEEQAALADRLRATLPEGWYVLTSAPAKADAKEPLYHVSKGGVIKSFPVPADPVAAK